MTENHPTTPPAAEPFVILPVSVLDSGVSSKALHVYASIRRHADNTTGETWVGRETLAEYLGSKRTATVDPYIRELVDAGLITSQVRWCSKRDRRDWVLEKDADHTVQGSNLYTIVDIAAGQTGYGKAYPRGTEKRTPRVRESGHELDPFNQTHTPRDEKTSVIAGAPTATPVDESAREERRWKAGERTAEPRPLHPEWSPNNANRAVAAEVGLDVEVAAEAFRQSMIAWDERRTEWGSTFSAYLREAAQGNAVNTFPAAEGDDMVTQAVEAAVESVRASQAPVSTPVDEVIESDPWGAAPMPQVVEMSSPARPGPVGYPREVEAVLVKVERMVGHLSGDERVAAAELAIGGETFSVIAGEVEVMRERALIAA